jgi:hypothetical protein
MALELPEKTGRHQQQHLMSAGDVQQHASQSLSAKKQALPDFWLIQLAVDERSSSKGILTQTDLNAVLGYPILKHLLESSTCSPVSSFFIARWSKRSSSPLREACNMQTILHSSPGRIATLVLTDVFFLTDYYCLLCWRYGSATMQNVQVGPCLQLTPWQTAISEGKCCHGCMCSARTPDDHQEKTTTLGFSP